MTSSPVRLSLVVPCYNEEEVLPETHRRILSTVGGRPDIDLEIVYVDDGSSDCTRAILRDLASADPRLRVVGLSRNFGHQQAVTAGLAHARGEAVVVMDADLQDPPEIVLEMLDLWREGWDVVHGVRTRRKGDSWFKRIAAAGFYRVLRWLSDVDIPVDSGDFSLMDRRVVDLLDALPEKNRYVRGLRAWSGFRQVDHFYERDPRAAGQTKYPWAKLWRLALDGIVDFSTKPLSIIFVVGATVCVGSGLAGALYVAARIWEFPIFGQRPGDAPGFTTLILALFFFSGVQILSIGVLGEYLGRVYREIKSRPVYVVGEEIGAGSREPEPDRTRGRAE